MGSERCDEYAGRMRFFFWRAQFRSGLSRCSLVISLLTHKAYLTKERRSAWCCKLHNVRSSNEEVTTGEKELLDQLDNCLREQWDEPALDYYYIIYIIYYVEGVNYHYQNDTLTKHGGIEMSDSIHRRAEAISCNLLSSVSMPSNVHIVCISEDKVGIISLLKDKSTWLCFTLNAFRNCSRIRIIYILM